MFRVDFRPEVLILNSPMSLILFLSPFSRKFRLITAGDSDAHSALALLCNDVTVANAELLRRLPQLRIVASMVTGVELIDLAECRRRGVAVSSAGRAYAEDVTDTAVGLLIDVMMRVSALDWYVRDRLYRSKGDYLLGFGFRAFGFE